MPPPLASQLKSARSGRLPPIHMKKIRMTPSVKGKLRKLWMYLAASDQDENALGPIKGNSATLPKVTFSPVSAMRMKQVAVIQCTKRSKALKRTILTPDRPE